MSHQEKGFLEEGLGFIGRDVISNPSGAWGLSREEVADVRRGTENSSLEEKVESARGKRHRSPGEKAGRAFQRQDRSA